MFVPKDPLYGFEVTGPKTSCFFKQAPPPQQNSNKCTSKTRSWVQSASPQKGCLCFQSRASASFSLVDSNWWVGFSFTLCSGQGFESHQPKPAQTGNHRLQREYHREFSGIAIMEKLQVTLLQIIVLSPPKAAKWASVQSGGVPLNQGDNGTLNKTHTQIPSVSEPPPPRAATEAAETSPSPARVPPPRTSR